MPEGFSVDAFLIGGREAEILGNELGIDPDQVARLVAEQLRHEAMTGIRLSAEEAYEALQKQAVSERRGALRVIRGGLSQKAETV